MEVSWWLGVPPVIIHFDGFSVINQPFLDTTIYGNPILSWFFGHRKPTSVASKLDSSEENRMMSLPNLGAQHSDSGDLGARIQSPSPYLLGGWPTPLKNDGFRQLGWWHSQLNGRKKTCSKPPTRYDHQTKGCFEHCLSESHQHLFKTQPLDQSIHKLIDTCSPSCQLPSDQFVDSWSYQGTTYARWWRSKQTSGHPIRSPLAVTTAASEDSWDLEHH